MFEGDKFMTPRQFKFTPYYYKPEENDENGHRISFRRIRRSKRPQSGNPVRIVVAAVILIMLIIYLEKVGGNRQEQAANRSNTAIQVEEVIVVD